jgi:hypothetical protein
MNKKEENKKAVPVIKQLARPMSKEELESVAGAPGGCAPSSNPWGNDDRLN